MGSKLSIRRSSSAPTKKKELGLSLARFRTKKRAVEPESSIALQLLFLNLFLLLLLLLSSLNNNNTTSFQLSALLILGMAAAAAAQSAPVAVTSDASVVAPSALAAPELAAQLSEKIAAVLSAAAAAPSSAVAAAASAAATEDELAAVAAMPEVDAAAEAAVAEMFAQAVAEASQEESATAAAAAATPVDAAAPAAAVDAATAAEAAAPMEAAAVIVTPEAPASSSPLSATAEAASRDLDLTAAAATASATAPAEHTAAALVFQDMNDEVSDLKNEALMAIQADEAASDAAAAAANGAESMPTNDASAATAATVAKYQDKVAKSVAAHSDVLTLLDAKKPEAAAQWDALRESINEAAEYEQGGPAVFAAASPRLASLLAKAEETEKALQETVEQARASGESLNSPEWKAKTVDAVVQALDEAKASSTAKAAVAAYEQAMAQASGAGASDGGGVINSFAARSGAGAVAPIMNEGDLEPIGGGSSLVAPSAGGGSDAAPLEMVAVGAREANPAKPTVDFLATLPKDVVAGWGADTVTKYLAAVASAAKVPLEDVDITAVSTEADAVDTRVTFSSKKDAESWVSKLKEGDDVSGLGAATAAAGLGTATASDVLLVGAGFGAATGEDEVTPAAAPSNGGGVKLSTGAIAGIAVGSAAGVALIAAVVVVLARRR